LFCVAINSSTDSVCSVGDGTSSSKRLVQNFMEETALNGEHEIMLLFQCTVDIESISVIVLYSRGKLICLGNVLSGLSDVN